MKCANELELQQWYNDVSKMEWATVFHDLYERSEANRAQNNKIYILRAIYILHMYKHTNIDYIHIIIMYHTRIQHRGICKS